MMTSTPSLKESLSGFMKRLQRYIDNQGSPARKLSNFFGFSLQAISTCQAECAIQLKAKLQKALDSEPQDENQMISFLISVREIRQTLNNKRQDLISKYPYSFKQGEGNLAELLNDILKTLAPKTLSTDEKGKYFNRHKEAVRSEYGKRDDQNWSYEHYVENQLRRLTDELSFYSARLLHLPEDKRTECAKKRRAFLDQANTIFLELNKDDSTLDSIKLKINENPQSLECLSISGEAKEQTYKWIAHQMKQILNEEFLENYLEEILETLEQKQATTPVAS